MPSGYPLNMIVEVEGANTLNFTINLDLGLNSTLLSQLNSTWSSIISLYFRANTTSNLIINYNASRLLTTIQSQPMAISNIKITNTSIVLYSTSISSDMLIGTHSFEVIFADNLISPKNVIYSIRGSTSTDLNPWVVGQYF